MSARAPLPPVDVLYVQVGFVNTSGDIYLALPAKVPAAAAYWLVVRFNETTLPMRGAAPLAKSFAATRAEALERGLKPEGIQLDFDSPTSSLPQYARYLHELRQQLPPGTAISITALLDWFRSGTSIDAVIREVDEFVPQFYDVEPNDRTRPPTVAARVDAKLWGPQFSRFGKPFRVGISSFGRARYIPASGRAYDRRDLRLLDLGLDPALTLITSRTDAGELIVTYESRSPEERGYQTISPGARMEFVMATSESIHSAWEQARQMGEYCIGAVFFRWPGFDESLAATPGEVLHAIGAQAHEPELRDSLAAYPGDCAAVSCTELYLLSTAIVGEPVRYRIEVSGPLEYFVPLRGSPARMTGPARIEFTLPPYAGRTRIRLGTAVATRPVTFTLEQTR